MLPVRESTLDCPYAESKPLCGAVARLFAWLGGVTLGCSSVLGSCSLHFAFGCSRRLAHAFSVYYSRVRLVPESRRDVTICSPARQCREIWKPNMSPGGTAHGRLGLWISMPPHAVCLAGWRRLGYAAARIWSPIRVPEGRHMLRAFRVADETAFGCSRRLAHALSVY